MRPIKLAIIIPTYNERTTLPILIDEIIKVLSEAVQKFFVIIVDDASPDGTGEIAEELSKNHENILAIHRKRKLGLGSAYKEGFGLAMAKIRPEFLVQMDADGSHDPKEIPLMLEKIESYDFGIASRHLEGSSIIGWSPVRKMIHSAAGTIAGVCGRINFRDSTSGFRIFKSYVIDSVDFSKIKASGFAFQIELLCYLTEMGFKGVEIPTKFVNRKEGKSKMGPNEVLQFINTCLYLLRRKRIVKAK